MPSGRGTHKSNQSSNRLWRGVHHPEHWYRANQVYFLTARCQGRYPAFASEEAKAIFWDRFDVATTRNGFLPWVTSLLDNHYHTIGWLERGEQLTPMMKSLHGGVSKLVNDLIAPRVRAGALRLPCAGDRLVPFWGETTHKSYFDGCLRDETQGRRTYRYVLRQGERHRVVEDWRDYPHTRVNVELEDAMAFARKAQAFLEGVPDKRYRKRGRGD